MRDYHIVVYYSVEDECYVASVPDLRGCMAHGDTPAQAVEEVTVAKELWLEVARENGDPIPEPTYRPAMNG